MTTLSAQMGVSAIKSFEKYCLGDTKTGRAPYTNPIITDPQPPPPIHRGHAQPSPQDSSKSKNIAILGEVP